MDAALFAKVFESSGVNAKGFYLLVYMTALRTLPLSLVAM